MKSVVGIGLVALSCVAFVGCATVQQASAMSKSSYETIWKASISSLPDIRYSATFTDKANGLIVAERRSGAAVTSSLNITLTKSANGVSIGVKYVPAQGVVTVGGEDAPDAFIQALRERVPDVRVSAK